MPATPGKASTALCSVIIEFPDARPIFPDGSKNILMVEPIMVQVNPAHTVGQLQHYLALILEAPNGAKFYITDSLPTPAARGALRKAPRRDDSRGVLSTAPVLPPQAQGCVEVQSDASQGFVVLTVQASRRFTFQLTA